MRLKNVLIVVNDIEKSKTFYKELFGLEIVLENEGNVILTEGLVLQDVTLWKDFLKKDITPQNNATELYFEEWEIDTFVKKLEEYKEPIQLVTPLMELPGGQKMLQLYDPDGHLIEVRTPWY